MTTFTHPHQEIDALLKTGASFYLSKKHWNGFSSRGHHLFVVTQCGPKWFKFSHVHNGARDTKDGERDECWITWKDFGAFTIADPTG